MSKEMEDLLEHGAGSMEKLAENVNRQLQGKEPQTSRGPCVRCGVETDYFHLQVCDRCYEEIER